jgi:hypothetical protein
VLSMLVWVLEETAVRAVMPQASMWGSFTLTRVRHSLWRTLYASMHALEFITSNVSCFEVWAGRVFFERVYSSQLRHKYCMLLSSRKQSTIS